MGDGIWIIVLYSDNYDPEKTYHGPWHYESDAMAWLNKQTGLRTYSVHKLEEPKP